MLCPHCGKEIVTPVINAVVPNVNGANPVPLVTHLNFVVNANNPVPVYRNFDTTTCAAPPTGQFITFKG